MTNLAPTYSKLADLARETSSDGRRELLRTVTDTLLRDGAAHAIADHAALDELLAAVTSDLSTQVRAEIAKLIAGSLKPFARTARQFAMDHIDVAAPVLKHSRILTDTDLLDVIAEKSHDHALAVTGRRELTQTVSHGLAQHTDDRVLVALLENKDADIGHHTYEALAARAQNNAAMHAPFVRRQGVPLDLLNDLYLKVEAGLRREILHKYNCVSPEELDRAFERSRKRLSEAYGAVPEDFDAAQRRIDLIVRQGGLAPPLLIALLREGKKARTAFEIAFGRLADVNYEMIHGVVETRDLDAIALLCRGADFERAVFVTLALALDDSERRMSRAEEFGELYESVPVQAAQRALQFWKVRTKG